MEERSWPAYAAEFIGAYLLVFFIAAIVTINSADGIGVTDYAVIGLVHTFVLAMLIYALGSTSGGHFNPAVTIALCAVRKIRGVDATVYVLLQLAGGVAAALTVKGLLLDEGRAVDYGATTISDLLSNGAFAGVIAEGIGTFALMFAIMGLAVNVKGEKAFAGLIIGATLGLSVMTFAPLTGAALNPARWFGPAVVANEYSDFWVYLVGPIGGALLAALVYTFVVIRPQHRAEDSPIHELP